MAQASSIEWTESTWNPVTGCTKISAGSAHCYAERMAKRLQAMGQQRYCNGFKVTLQPDVVELPLHWKRPRMIFVNSMSDLFHRHVPTEFIAECFAVMQRASQHTFQVLTKRPERAAELAPNFLAEQRLDGNHGRECRLPPPHSLTDSDSGRHSLPFP